MMERNPLCKLGEFGQSVWMDFISRNVILSGELEKLIADDGLAGVTSNPAIFEKAIAGSNDYDDDIRTLARAGKSAEEIYQELTVEDIRMAADLFRPLYERLDGSDGYVSLEVSPLLARDTAGTIHEAHRLWHAVDRPNVMIKVPATMEGLPAISRLIGDGINVNVTLLFGLPRYRQVVEAYLTGLETLHKAGGSLGRIASVASFFLSRIDVLVDPLLEEVMRTGGKKKETASALIGGAAVASAKVAATIYRELFSGERFMRLATLGGRTQRLLWASTGTKNPDYSDTKYVEPLIGRSTINTMPPETLAAYRDHGKPALRLSEGVDEAHAVLRDLTGLGINLDAVTGQLEDEGVNKFIVPYEKLMGTLRDRLSAERKGKQSFD